MADLSGLYVSNNVKIVGSDSTGLESNFVNANAQGELKIIDELNTNAVQTTLNVTTTAVAANVSGTNLTGRKLLLIQCQTNSMTYGFSSGSQPFELSNGTTITFAIGPNITIYLRRTTGDGPVVVAELS